MKLLVGIDGSEQSGKAVGYAAALAAATGGSVTLAYVVDPAVYSEGGGEPLGAADTDRRLVIESEDDAEDRGLAVLDEARVLVEDGVTVATELLYGDPVGELVDFADEHGFDGLVVGHRGLSKRTERVVGSVAKGVLGGATVPVTVVP